MLAVEDDKAASFLSKIFDVFSMLGLDFLGLSKKSSLGREFGAKVGHDTVFTFDVGVVVNDVVSGKVFLMGLDFLASSLNSLILAMMASEESECLDRTCLIRSPLKLKTDKTFVVSSF